MAIAAVAYTAASMVFGLVLLLPLLALGAASFLSGGGDGGGSLFALYGTVSFVLWPLSLLAVWGALYWERLTTRSVLVGSLRSDTFDPTGRSLRMELVPLAPGERRRLQVVDDLQQRHNLTAYSGYFPFLGAGGQIRTWSFGIDLSRGTPDPIDNGSRTPAKAPQPFRVSELQDYLTERLEALRSPSLDPGQRIDGLIVEDRLFVHGTDVWRDRRLLPDVGQPPVAWVPPELLRQIGDDPGGVVRHFKCARVESWGREVVLSVFLHFATDGRTLYVEQTACLLPPIDARYRVVDRMTRRLSSEDRSALLWVTLKDAPAALLRAPVELWRGWRSKQRERKHDDRLRAAVAEGLPMDYGASVSVRELGAGGGCRFWFQQLDAAKHQKIIELHVLNAILDFLESHHVDTAEFRGRQASILNNNTLIAAGDISGSQIAIGTGATATMAGTPPPATAAAN
ncbi:MAG TPA: hypothetical protein VGC06_00435 [Actinomycetes bacterium]